MTKDKTDEETVIGRRVIGLLAFNCQAVNWEYLDGYPDGSLKYYGDTDSRNLKRHTGMVRKVSSLRMASGFQLIM